MKLWALILTSIVLSGCQVKTDKTMQKSNPSSFFVGTYTNANSEGIYKYQLNSDGTLDSICLAAKSQFPSFLTLSYNRENVLAVNEISNEEGVGSVESFLIEGDSLKFLSRSSSGGAHPCFIRTNKDNFVLVANYSGGNIALLKLNEVGQLSELLDVNQHTGKGTTDRQEAPHAHSVWFTPDNKKVISVDLGTNELWFSEIESENNKILPSEPKKLAMADGAGPRHLDFHPNGKWIYVVNELNCTVTQVVKTKAGAYELGATITTLPKDFEGYNLCADIHISSDGKFLYASNRGHNSIVVYKVNEVEGALEILEHESVRGDWPRNFSISPSEEYLVVANQKSNNLVSFKRDKATGLLEYVNQINAPTPVCILFN